MSMEELDVAEMACDILRNQVKQLQTEFDGLKARFGFDEKKITDSGQVTHRWIIVKKPNTIPYVIKPLKNSHQGIVDMLQENQTIYPEAETIVAYLAYGGQLWVENGKEILALEQALNNE